MKLVSKRASTGAMAAALGLVAVLGAAPIAYAKEKPAPAAPAAPPLSAEFRKVAVPAQTAVQAQAWADASAKLDAAEPFAKAPYEKFVVAQLRYLTARGLKDTAMENRALDAMIASGGAPATMAPILNLQVGSNAYAAGNFAKALPLLLDAQRLGATDEQLPILITDTYYQLGNVPAGMAALEKAIATKKAAGQAIPEGWYKRARAAAYKAKMDAEIGKWSRLLVADYPTPGNWRDALVVYRDTVTRPVPINMDLFRLMRMTKSLDGERDYYEYASTAFDGGLPGEAKAVAEEGFALGKVPAGSRSLTEVRTLATGKIAADRASLPASEKAAATSARTALATADAYLGYGEDAKAIALYQSAIAKGGIDLDTANMRLGIALLRSGQREAALAAFAKVNPTGPRGELVAFWTLFANQKPAA